MNTESVKLIAGIYMSMLVKVSPEVEFTLTENAANGNIVVGFNCNDMIIHDPSITDCGRFDLDEQDAINIYEITTSTFHTLISVNRYLESLQA